MLEIDDEKTWGEKVLLDLGVVIVDFWAEWCGPCRMYSPIFESLEKDFKGKKVTFVKVNTDRANALASTYQIFSIPTTLLFKNGKMSDQLTGVRSKEELASLINRRL